MRDIQRGFIVEGGELVAIAADRWRDATTGRPRFEIALGGGRIGRLYPHTMAGGEVIAVYAEAPADVISAAARHR